MFDKKKMKLVNFEKAKKYLMEGTCGRAYEERRWCIMDVCILQGKSITPEMPGACNRCGLYLNTCSPIVENGFLVGAECDYDYCCDCPYYEECGQ